MGAVHGAYGADDLVVRPLGRHDRRARRRAGGAGRIARARGLDLRTSGPRRGDARPVACAQLAGGAARRVPARPAGRHVHQGRLRRRTAACRAGQPGSRAAASARRCATPRGPCSRPRPPPPRTRREIGELRAELGRRYDSYLAAYGPLNRFSLRRTGRANPATGEPVMARIRPRQGGFAADPFAPLVYALEEFDPVGQRAAKAAIFRERVIAPRAPRLGADTPADALAICLDTCGEVRLDEIARLLGTTEDDAREQLGTLVFDDPGTGRLVPAAEYLSGNVREKLRRRRARRRGRPRVRGQRHRTAPGDPGRSHARARSTRGSARPGSTPAYVQQFLREMLDDPRLQRRASRRPDLGGPRQPGHRARPVHLGHQPLPRAASSPRPCSNSAASRSTTR